MRITVTAISSEDKISDSYIKELETYSGKAAGVCYMKDAYFGTSVDDADKAKTRFDRVISTGHHSIADHSFISVVFEEIPKMTAMILNSIGFYNTSEKSGRYTIMKSDYQSGSENERLYYKWLDKFKNLIDDYDSEMKEKDPKLREKLSMENARYVLSVFAPNTTMMFTTSLRMWSYIVCWCKDYIDTADESTEFNKLVKKCVNDLYLNILHTGCYSDKIFDNKGRKFNFLARQVGYPIYESYTHTGFSDSYLIKYRSSFAELAQEQRHRTLRYFMCFDGSQNLNFYIPPIIVKKEDKDEWVDDLKSVQSTYPIATLVEVVESGLITDFMLKCDERLCGRAMLETMNTVKNNLYILARSWNKSPFTIHELERHMKDGKLIMKCGNIECKEPCYWGPVKAQNKLI